MKEEASADTAAALHWMSGVVAEKEGRFCDVILGALKSVVSKPGYVSTFGYDDLIAWVKENISPDEAADFWIAVAHVCGGKEKPESLARFPRWGEAEPVPLEEGLRAVAALEPV